MPSYPDPSWLPSPRPLGYRNRIRMQVVGGLPRFFNQEKSADCAVLEPSLLQLRRQLVEVAPNHPELLLPCSHLELRGPDADGLGGLALFTSKERIADLNRRLNMGSSKLLPNVVTRAYAFPDGTGEAAVFESACQRQLLTGRTYTYVPLRSFMQVNHGMNRQLVQLVRDIALEFNCQDFIDLFCGCGNFSLPLLAEGLKGSGVESDPAAIAALRRAATEQGFVQGADGPDFRADDARLLGNSRAPADLVIVDPPRAGLRQGVEWLPVLAPRLIVMCYCDVNSFAKDASVLCREHFHIKRLWAADMFPQTAHTEVLALLERSTC